MIHSVGTIIVVALLTPDSTPGSPVGPTKANEIILFRGCPVCNLNVSQPRSLKEIQIHLAHGREGRHGVRQSIKRQTPDDGNR